MLTKLVLSTIGIAIHAGASTIKIDLVVVDLLQMQVCWELQGKVCVSRILLIYTSSLRLLYSNQYWMDFEVIADLGTILDALQSPSSCIKIDSLLVELLDVQVWSELQGELEFPYIDFPDKTYLQVFHRNETWIEFDEIVAETHVEASLANETRSK